MFTFIVIYIIGLHSNSLRNNVSTLFKQKISIERDYEVYSILKHIYLNDYAEFDSNIS